MKRISASERLRRVPSRYLMSWPIWQSDHSTSCSIWFCLLFLPFSLIVFQFLGFNLLAKQPCQINRVLTRLPLSKIHTFKIDVSVVFSSQKDNFSFSFFLFYKHRLCVLHSEQKALASTYQVVWFYPTITGWTTGCQFYRAGFVHMKIVNHFSSTLMYDTL